MAENFVAILESKTNFKVETGRLFFSPLGRVQGRDLFLEGKVGEEAVFVRIHQYQIEPRENLIKEMWARQENFRFEDLHYNCIAKKVTLWSKKNGQRLTRSRSHSSMRWESIEVKFGEEAITFELNHGQLKKEKLVMAMDSLKGEWQGQRGELVLRGMNASQKGLGHLSFERFQANIELPEPWSVWRSQLEGDHALSVLDAVADIRCSSLLMERDDGERFQLKGLRWLKRDENLWKLDAEGTIREKDVFIDAQVIKKISEESSNANLKDETSEIPEKSSERKGSLAQSIQWSLQGQQWLKEFWEHPIHYEVKYSPSRSKLIQFVLYDVLQNRIAIEASLDEGVVVTTWKAQLANVPLPNQDWPSLKGRLSGGASYHLEDQQ